MTFSTKDCIILALDGLHQSKINTLLEKLGDRIYAVKIHDLADHYGAKIAQSLKEDGAPRVWIDYKLHDIPTTVKLRAAIALAGRADIVSVHASGGGEMMQAAISTGIQVYAITTLSSMDPDEVAEIYNTGHVAAAARLVALAARAEVHGVVCAPTVVKAHAFGNKMLGIKHEIIVPGTRSPGVAHNDQKNVETPADAILNGATKLVIGREITASENPSTALDLIEEAIGLALSRRDSENVGADVPAAIARLIKTQIVDDDFPQVLHETDRTVYNYHGDDKGTIELMVLYAEWRSICIGTPGFSEAGDAVVKQLERMGAL